MYAQMKEYRDLQQKKKSQNLHKKHKKIEKCDTFQ